MTFKVLPAPGFEPGSGLEPFHFSVLLCKFVDFTLYYYMHVGQYYFYLQNKDGGRFENLERQVLMRGI